MKKKVPQIIDVDSQRMLPEQELALAVVERAVRDYVTPVQAESVCRLRGDGRWMTRRKHPNFARLTDSETAEGFLFGSTKFRELRESGEFDVWSLDEWCDMFGLNLVNIRKGISAALSNPEPLIRRTCRAVLP